MSQSAAEIVREYGPFPGVDQVHGVTYDGQRVWFAAGEELIAFDPATGKTLRSIAVAANARRGSHPEDRPGGRAISRSLGMNSALLAGWMEVRSKG